MKLTKRKGFNFFRSYYDVYNELDDESKLAFIDALLDRQFLGVKPTDLKGMSKFAYISQVHSIDSQVDGYESKTGVKLLNTPTEGGEQGGLLGGVVPPTAQLQGKEEGKEEGKGKEKKELLIIKDFENDELNSVWGEWVQYRIERKNKLTPSTVKAQKKKLEKFSDAQCIQAIRNSIENGYLGLFPESFDTNGNKENKVAQNGSKSPTLQDRVDVMAASQAIRDKNLNNELDFLDQ